MNQHPDYLLNKITGPADVKQLTLEEMEQLATEIRQLVVEKDAAIGGHVGPTLVWPKQRLHITMCSTHQLTRLFGIFRTRHMGTRC